LFVCSHEVISMQHDNSLFIKKKPMTCQFIRFFFVEIWRELKEKKNLYKKG
jgi:hypothetical protein